MTVNDLMLLMKDSYSVQTLVNGREFNANCIFAIGFNEVACYSIRLVQATKLGIDTSMTIKAVLDITTKEIVK